MNSNRAWKLRLALLRDKPADCDFPLRTFTFGLPSGDSWPTSLPASPRILEFFSIVDGGWFGVDCDWYGIGDLVPKNDEYYGLLHNWNPDNTSPLKRGQHLIFGHDAEGNPYIWNASNDSVFLFRFKGAGWLKIATSFEEFVTKLLYPAAPLHEDDLWYDALKQLDSLNK